MSKQIDKAYWKSYNFNNISLILGVGYGFSFSFLSKFLKSLRTFTRFYLALGCAKYESPHAEWFATSRTHNRTKCSTSFLDISSCTFGAGCSCKHIGSASYFNLKYIVSIFYVPSIPSNNSSNFCNHFSNSLHYVNVKYLHWVSITLCKFSFSYLASKITRNGCVAVRTCSESYTYST